MDKLYTVTEIAENISCSGQTVRRIAKELGFSRTSGKKLLFTANEASVIAAKLNKRTVNDSSVSSGKAEFAALESEIEMLRVKCEMLVRENDLLRDRLRVADEALEREQNKPRGISILFDAIAKRLPPAK